MTFQQIKDAKPNRDQLVIVDNGADESWPTVMCYSESLDGKYDWVSYEGDCFEIDETDWWTPCPRREV